MMFCTAASFLTTFLRKSAAPGKELRLTPPLASRVEGTNRVGVVAEGINQKLALLAQIFYGMDGKDHFCRGRLKKGVFGGMKTPFWGVEKGVFVGSKRGFLEVPRREGVFDNTD